MLHTPMVQLYTPPTGLGGLHTPPIYFLLPHTPLRWKYEAPYAQDVGWMPHTPKRVLHTPL